jgi:ribosomal protein S18 acetylase RimI-like enzyme
VVGVREYRDGDLDAVREICVRTGYRGTDATGVLADPALLPDTFAEPYLVYDPGLAFVADNHGTPVGYILGAADTPAFAGWFRTTWLPRVAPGHQPPAGTDEFGRLIHGLLHDPARMVHADLADHPAHLHIDLLPGYQGQGLGRRLMDAFRAALRARGVERLHLSMDPANTNARAFYARLGFEPIAVRTDPGGLYLGRSTAG